MARILAGVREHGYWIFFFFPPIYSRPHSVITVSEIYTCHDYFVYTAASFWNSLSLVVRESKDLGSYLGYSWSRNRRIPIGKRNNLTISGVLLDVVFPSSFWILSLNILTSDVLCIMKTSTLLFITQVSKVSTFFVLHCFTYSGRLMFLNLRYFFARPWKTLPKAEINAASPLLPPPPTPFSTFFSAPFFAVASPWRRKIIFQALELVSGSEFWFPMLFMSGHRPPSLSSFVYPLVSRDSFRFPFFFLHHNVKVFCWMKDEGSFFDANNLKLGASLCFFFFL